MANAPADQVYWGDILRDTELQKADATARGIWVANALPRMWFSKIQGQISGTPEQLARTLNATPEELGALLSQIKTYKFGDIYTDEFGIVTLTNRRMYRNYLKRENAKERAAKSRSVRKSHTNVTTLSPTPKKKRLRTAPSPTPSPNAGADEDLGGSKSKVTDEELQIMSKIEVTISKYAKRDITFKQREKERLIWWCRQKQNIKMVIGEYEDWPCFWSVVARRFGDLVKGVKAPGKYFVAGITSKDDAYLLSQTAIEEDQGLNYKAKYLRKKHAKDDTS